MTKKMVELLLSCCMQHNFYCTSMQNIWSNSEPSVFFYTNMSPFLLVISDNFTFIESTNNCESIEQSNLTMSLWKRSVKTIYEASE